MMKIRVNVIGCTIEQKMAVIVKLEELTGLKFTGNMRERANGANFLGNVRVGGEVWKSLVYGYAHSAELEKYTVSYSDFMYNNSNSIAESISHVDSNLEQYRELYEVATFDDFVQTLLDAKILK
ncbi:hypothetical protein VmeM32_00070 [Vibrio phage vB_VmeM-32]|nr:hypothetical protein VmeM32_00070 [Vibrio phage vB_VmeM-32]